jgi:hypothetical protein
MFIIPATKETKIEKIMVQASLHKKLVRVNLNK